MTLLIKAAPRSIPEPNNSQNPEFHLKGVSIESFCCFEIFSVDAQAFGSSFFGGGLSVHYPLPRWLVFLLLTLLCRPNDISTPIHIDQSFDLSLDLPPPCQSDCFEAFLRWLLESRPQHLLPLTSAPPLLTINRQCYCYSSILKLTFREKKQWRKVKQMPLHCCQQSIDKSTATSTKIQWRKALHCWQSIDKHCFSTALNVVNHV